MSGSPESSTWQRRAQRRILTLFEVWSFLSVFRLSDPGSAAPSLRWWVGVGTAVGEGSVERGGSLFKTRPFSGSI